MKYCPKCKETKSFDLFNKNKTTKDGFQKYCNHCRYTLQIEYRKNNKEKINAAAKKYRLKNKEKFLKIKQKYRSTIKGKAKHSALQAKRNAAKLQRTPKWLVEDDFFLIEEAYSLATLRTKMTGIEWQVDHIIPMQGKTVSGLHCPTNLQVIPSKVNISKNNKWDWITQK